MRITTFAGPSVVLGYMPGGGASAVVVIDALIRRFVNFIDGVKIINSGHDGFLFCEWRLRNLQSTRSEAKSECRRVPSAPAS